MFNNPESLGMQAAFKMVTAPIGRTFHYRNEDKRIIEIETLNESRFRKVRGPLVYAVTDSQGVVRYLGKWETETPLYARWFRRNHLHHQTSSRNIFLAELDANRGPLTVWSVSAPEIKERLGMTTSSQLPDKEFVKYIEALWIARWGSQLWNKQNPSYPHWFCDSEYWRNNDL